MKKAFLTVLMTITGLGTLFAGDISTFVNLGFSPDGKYFMFGQHGLQPDRGKAYAEVYVVDIAANKFVSNGALKGEFGIAFDPGQTALGAMINLLESNVSLKERFRIDHLKTGRLLYLDVEDPAAGKEKDPTMDAAPVEDAANSLEFRDFATGRSFRMSLVQNAEESGGDVRSSFYILMDVSEASGQTHNYTVGHPHFKRSGITGYRIVRVIAGPDNRSLVLIISKMDRDSNVRYMVETIKLK